MTDLDMTKLRFYLINKHHSFYKVNVGYRGNDRSSMKIGTLEILPIGKKTRLTESSKELFIIEVTNKYLRGHLRTIKIYSDLGYVLYIMSRYYFSDNVIPQEECRYPIEELE